MKAIVASARRRLNDDDELTMRAVAADVGLTGPGLYRYVNSMSELRLLMIHEIIGRARGSLDDAGSRYDDSREKMVVGAAAFRRWALQYPAEFRLAFASPGLLSSYSSDEIHGLAKRIEVERINSPGLVGEYFSPLFNDVLEDTEDQWSFDQTIMATFESQAASYSSELPQYAYLKQADTPAAVWVHLYLWARLYGVVAFEVFNYVEPETITSALLFRNMIFEMATITGAKLSPADVNALIDAEIARAGVIS